MEIYIHNVPFMHPDFFYMWVIEKYIGNRTYINQGLCIYAMGGGGEEMIRVCEWSICIFHVKLVNTTNNVTGVWINETQSDMDRRCKQVEHLHSVNTYTDPNGNLTLDNDLPTQWTGM